MRLETDPIALYRESRAVHHSLYGTHRVSARNAWDCAKRNAATNRRWNAAESAGLVRVEMRTDCDPSAWDNFFDGDMYDPEKHPDHPGGERTINAERKRVESLAESYGFAGVVGEYRTAPDGEWIESESVWGFLGNETPNDSGYGADVMLETLDALTDALRTESKRRADVRAGRCTNCHGTGKA